MNSNLKLKDYFPMIRTREEILKKIKADNRLNSMFAGWTTENREEFLDFCTGQKGVKILYDAYFKEVMNPEYYPERLNEFLSLLLGREVRVLHILPNDGTRLADEASLLVMDIVVELSDGSIANVEVQRIGYAFPGERAACYSADLLLRQYKRIRDSSDLKKKKMSYRAIKTVYTIVLFEKSTQAFHEFPEQYIHCFEQKSDTGLELDLVQRYLFVPLDIFRENLHNKGIRNKLDAWLAFMSEDDPSWIVRLVTEYPRFRAMYETIYTMCSHVERVMEMFSEELRMLDKNTVMGMIDEMQEEINKKTEKLNRQDAELDQAHSELTRKDAELDQAHSELNRKDEELDQAHSELNRKDEELDQAHSELTRKDAELDQAHSELNRQDAELERLKKMIEELQGKIISEGI